MFWMAPNVWMFDISLNNRFRGDIVKNLINARAATDKRTPHNFPRNCTLSSYPSSVKVETHTLLFVRNNWPLAGHMTLSEIKTNIFFSYWHGVCVREDTFNACQSNNSL